MTERPALGGEPEAVKALYPEDDKYNKSLMKLLQDKREHVEQRITHGDVVAITDTDLDGLGCAAVLRREHGAIGHVHASHDERVSAASTLEMVGEQLGDGRSPDHVYICDLPPNEPADYREKVAAISETASVTICDHHDTWTDEMIAAFDGIAEVHIGSGISATEVTHNAVSEGETSPGWERFVSLVTDHDCGQRDDDPDSTRLADYAEAVTAVEFVRSVVDDRGTPLDSEAVLEAVDDYRERKEERIAHAVRRARIHSDVETAKLVTTYGRCPASQTAERLFDEVDADIVVIVKPHDKINVRTVDEYPVAREIAELFWGGGHDDEAGAKPGFYGKPPSADLDVRGGPWYRDAIPWSEHWATMGEEARRRVEMAVKHVLDEG